jgi:hypothetical protein
MCEECEQAETLSAAYVRKTNRYGWQPPAQVATIPRYDNAVATAAPIPRGGLTCVEVVALNTANDE